ncbi:MAG: GNAT family N-acetyltransferase [Desulfobacteraceae bacterium]|nr:GNAT family N-acetyltransferase [Desulfobacteraceae bacterium]
MNKIIIRSLEEKDALKIRDIYASIIQKPVKTDFVRLIEAHAQRDQDACFVAELDGKVIGFMISYILTLGFGIEKSAWIATLGVDPTFMGQGVGASMAQEIFKFYKSQGITSVYTSVRWDSPDLLSFFKTMGFDRSNFINLKKAI